MSRSDGGDAGPQSLEPAEADAIAEAVLSADYDAPARVPLTCRVFGHNWEQTRDSVSGPWLFRCPKCLATAPIPPVTSYPDMPCEDCEQGLSTCCVPPVVSEGGA